MKCPNCDFENIDESSPQILTVTDYSGRNIKNYHRNPIFICKTEMIEMWFRVDVEGDDIFCIGFIDNSYKRKDGSYNSASSFLTTRDFFGLNNYEIASILSFIQFHFEMCMINLEKRKKLYLQEMEEENKE